jgi:hypothetical protein
MAKTQSVSELEQRYRKLARRLAKTGPILRGTITERTIDREDPARPGRKKTYGPYYQWTFKQKGKTKTVNLTKAQAKVFQKAIENNRKIEKTIQEMRILSLKICEAKTKGVAKRKTRK